MQEDDLQVALTEDTPHTAQYKGKKPWRFTVESDFIRGADGGNGKRLSAMARMLYLIIQSYVGPNSPVPFPKVTTIAHYMGVGTDTLRRYTAELVEGNWLRVEQRRGGWNQFGSNSYILLDGEPYVENPCTDNPLTAKPCAADPSTADTRTKSTQVKCVPSVKERNHEVKRRTSSNTVAPSAAPGAAAAPEFNLAGATAPAPPGASPEAKAEGFIRMFRDWGTTVGLPVSITPRDTEAVVGFFEDNTDYKPGNLFTIMLAAWMMDPEAMQEGTDRKMYWFCTKKGRRVLTFMKHLTEIQDELGWRGVPDQIKKVQETAHKRFVVKKEKLVA